MIDWTLTLVNDLRAHVAAGMTGSEAARAMGVTRNMVMAKAWRLGLQWRSGLSSVEKAKRPQQLPQRSSLPARPIRTAVVIPIKPRTLLELGPGLCRWPINSPEPGEEMLFCGSRGFPYCPPHHSLAYRPPQTDQRQLERRSEAVEACLAQTKRKAAS